MRDGAGAFRHFSLSGREFVIDSIKVEKGGITKYLFDAVQVADFAGTMQAEKTSYISCRQTGKLLGISPITIRQKVASNHGRLNVSLLDGREFELDTCAREGGREDTFFKLSQVKNLLAEIKKQNSSIMTISRIVEKLSRMGIETTRHLIYGIFRSEGNPLIVTVGGRKRQIELKSARGGKKSSGNQRYLTSVEFRAFAKWMKRRAGKATASRGYIWLTEANDQLGFMPGTLKRQAVMGLIPTKKKNRQHMITLEQFEKLKIQYASKIPPRDAVSLLKEVAVYGYSTHWLSERVVKNKNGTFLVFTAEDGKSRQVPVYQDKHNKYWVSRADFAEFRRVESLFGPKGVYCDLKSAAETLGLSMVTLQQSTRGSMLPLHLPGVLVLAYLL